MKLFVLLDAAARRMRDAAVDWNMVKEERKLQCRAAMPYIGTLSACCAVRSAAGGGKNRKPEPGNAERAIRKSGTTRFHPMHQVHKHTRLMVMCAARS
jgi:hypothetical protein